MARFPILLGRLAGASLVAATKAAILVAVFLAFGAEVKGGPAAVLVIMVVAALLVLCFAADLWSNVNCMVVATPYVPTAIPLTPDLPQALASSSR